MSRLRLRDKESLVLVILTSFCPQLHHRNPDSSDPAWVISTTSNTYNILPGFRAPSPPAWDRSFFSLRTSPKAPHLASSMLTQHQNQAERVTQVGLGPKEYKHNRVCCEPKEQADRTGGKPEPLRKFPFKASPSAHSFNPCTRRWAGLA